LGLLAAKGPADLQGKAPLSFVHPDDRGWAGARLQKVVAGQAVKTYERRMLRLDGQTRVVAVTSVPFSYQGRRAVLSIMTDVTELRRLERDLVEVAEREQRRIGQDLHDGLCQELVSMAFLANSIKPGMSPLGARERRDIGRLASALDHAITVARSTAQGLFQVASGPEGLASCLRKIVHDTRLRHSVACRFDYPKPVLLPNETAAAQLYRIAREALNNALKHARPDRIILRLTRSARGIQLSILDNGIGISQRKDVSQAGLGIRIMSYRAESIGGTLQVYRQASGGTAVVCTLPESGN
jgi:signal transduction histidine kinase